MDLTTRNWDADSQGDRKNLLIFLFDYFLFPREQ